MKSAVFIKLAIGAVLFLTWVALVVLKVSGTEDIIAFIKVGLGGLGIYHSLMTTPGGQNSVPPAELIQGQAVVPAATAQDSTTQVSAAPAPAIQTLQ